MRILPLVLLAGSCHAPLASTGPPEDGRCDFVGRLLGVDGQPILSSQPGAGLSRWSRGSSSWSSVEVSTDDEGRFRFSLRETEDRCALELRVPAEGVETYAEAVVDLTWHYASGEVDLGDVRCYVPDSPTRWTGFDDRELVMEFERWDRLHGWREVEGILMEMGERGGDVLSAFLDRQLATLSDDSLEWKSHERILAVTRAWTMSRGGDDPLRLELDVEGDPECTFPELPVLRWRLVNRHPERTLVVVEGGSYRSGRFARVRAQVIGVDGLEEPPLELRASMGGGMYQHASLAPGAGLDGATALARYVEPPDPGRYTVTLHYHDAAEIDTDPFYRAYMTVAADPFTLEVKPREVKLTRAEFEEAVADVRALDTTQPVPLTSATWSPEMRFEGDPVGPADRLFRRGWASLPALLTVLSEGDIDLDRADWITGLCFDITGLHVPGNLGSSSLANVEWIDRWPRSDADPVQAYGEWNVAGGAVSPDVRRAYHARWRALRDSVVLVLQD